MIMCLLVNQCLFSVSTLSLCLIQKLLQVKNAVNILLRFTQINSGCFDFFFFSSYGCDRCRIVFLMKTWSKNKCCD